MEPTLAVTNMIGMSSDDDDIAALPWKHESNDDKPVTADRKSSAGQVRRSRGQSRTDETNRSSRLTVSETSEQEDDDCGRTTCEYEPGSSEG
jgi:hypothetical protein